MLLLSAWAKWQEPDSTTSAITLLRLPSALQQRWVARALPVGEAVLALAMVSPWSPIVKVASWGALVLFVIYLVVIARAMTFRPRPSCGCFGRIGDQRVRARTVWRNALFVALAAVFVWFAHAGHTVPGTLWHLSATDWAWLLGAAISSAATLLVAGSPEDGSHVQKPVPPPAQAGPPASDEPGVQSHFLGADLEPDAYIREPIPSGLLVSPDGDPVTLHELAASRAQLLIFGNCYCGPTMAALRSTAGWADRLPAIDVRYVFSGVNPVAPEPGGPDTGWRDHAGLLWAQWGFSASPAAVLLGADRLMAGGPVNGLEEVEAFVAEVESALEGADSQADSQAEAEASETVH